MVALKLVRLIEKHSEELVQGRANRSVRRNVCVTSAISRQRSWNWRGGGLPQPGRLVTAKDRRKYREAVWGNRRTPSGRAN